YCRCYSHYPTGHVWPVRLEKASVNTCWFCDGWQEFAEHHSILAGYFLVFEYEGNSNFKISIFDLTTCEISYPCNPSNGSEKQYHGKRSSVHPEEEMEDDVSVEILGSSPPFQAPTSLKSAKTSFKAGLGIKKHGRNDDSFQSPKSKHVCFRESRKYKMDSQMFDHNQTESDEDDSVIERRKEAKTRARTPSPKRCGRTKGRERILHAPRMSKPENRSFSVTMRPHNIESRFLNVPAAFARKYLRRKSIELRDSGGGQWPLKCLHHQRGSVMLSKGWKDFVEEKNLKEGDVCFFELVHRKDPVLKVSIFQ
ncbi:B3 domain-containing transcription factor VRN1, partial [Vitis vinifera]